MKYLTTFVIFLRKLIRGGADHSYGIQVANMAGLPRIVIERAKEILENLESHSLDLTNNKDTPETDAINQKKSYTKNDRKCFYTVRNSTNEFIC